MITGARLRQTSSIVEARPSRAAVYVIAFIYGQHNLQELTRQTFIRTTIHTPQATSNTPAILPIHIPLGTTFSSSTKPAMAATHHMFITPATNTSALRNQQQPRQYTPCLRPMPNAPSFPSRQP